VTQYLFPASIKQAEIEPKLAPKSSGFSDAKDFRRRYPDGRVGSDPTLSHPDHGQRIFDCAVEGLGLDYQAFMAEN